MLEALFLTRAVGYALVVARIAGFVVSSPFPGAHVSTSQRVGLVAVLAWLASGFAPIEAAPTQLGIRLFLHTGIELAVGLAIGVTFRFLFFAGEVLGQVISQAVGLSSPSVLNPTIEAEDAIMARLITLAAMLLALATGVHRVALAYLFESFRQLPVGSDVELSHAALHIVDLVVLSFAEGVRIGLPIVGVELVVHLALAMISRAAPALQIFSVGLSVLLATGCATLLIALGDFMTSLTSYYASLAGRLDEVCAAIMARGP
jgi:flagellar biosynthetic protein FliR